MSDCTERPEEAQGGNEQQEEQQNELPDEQQKIRQIPDEVPDERMIHDEFRGNSESNKKKIPQNTSLLSRCISFGGWAFDIFTVLISLVDVVSDILVAKQFFDHGDTLWAWLIVGFFINAGCVYSAFEAGVGTLEDDLLGSLFPQWWEHRVPVVLRFFILLPLSPLYPALHWTLATFCVDDTRSLFKKTRAERVQDDYKAFDTSAAVAQEEVRGIKTNVFVMARLDDALKRQLRTHAMIIAETVFESIPQSIIQLLAITFLPGTPSTLQLVSLTLSLLSVVSKGYLLSFSCDAKVFAWKFAVVGHDIFSMFYLFSTVLSKDRPREVHAFASALETSFLSYVWMWKVVVYYAAAIVFGVALLALFLIYNTRERDWNLRRVQQVTLCFLISVVCAVPVFFGLEGMKLTWILALLFRREPKGDQLSTATPVMAFLSGTNAPHKGFHHSDKTSFFCCRKKTSLLSSSSSLRLPSRYHLSERIRRNMHAHVFLYNIMCNIRKLEVQREAKVIDDHDPQAVYMIVALRHLRHDDFRYAEEYLHLCAVINSGGLRNCRLQCNNGRELSDFKKRIHKNKGSSSGSFELGGDYEGTNKSIVQGAEEEGEGGQTQVDDIHTIMGCDNVRDIFHTLNSNGIQSSATGWGAQTLGAAAAAVATYNPQTDPLRTIFKREQCDSNIIKIGSEYLSSCDAKLQELAEHYTKAFETARGKHKRKRRSPRNVAINISDDDDSEEEEDDDAEHDKRRLIINHITNDYFAPRKMFAKGVAYENRYQLFSANVNKIQRYFLEPSRFLGIILVAIGSLLSLLFPFLNVALYHDKQNTLQQICLYSMCVCLACVVLLCPYAVSYIRLLFESRFIIGNITMCLNTSWYDATEEQAKRIGDLVESYYLPSVADALVNVLPKPDDAAAAFDRALIQQQREMEEEQHVVRRCAEDDSGNTSGAKAEQHQQRKQFVAERSLPVDVIEVVAEYLEPSNASQRSVDLSRLTGHECKAYRR